MLSLAGLVVSTVTVALAGAATASWPAPARSVVLPLVQAGTFAALWVVQFVVLDRVIFRTPRARVRVPPIPRPTPPTSASSRPDPDQDPR